MGFYQGISMGPYSTFPSSGWSNTSVTAGTYYTAQASIHNYDDPQPPYWYRNVYLQFGTSDTNPTQIAQWTSAWDGSSQDRSISLSITNGTAYYIIITLN